MSTIVNELFKIPKKDKGVNATKFIPVPKNDVHQSDLLFMPDDHGYKYALVVVDVGSRLTDAIPLKNKDSTTIITAFNKIYKRQYSKILEFPKKIEFDAGSEFDNNAVHDYFTKNKTVIRIAKVQRHRQQGIVERRNQIIGVELFKRMVEEELQTKHSSTQWKDDLDEVVEGMNDKAKKNKPKKLSNKYQCAGDACELLSEGTKVRVALEAPRDVASDKKLHGKFRSHDIRWEINPREIKQVIIQPNQPPMYLVSDDKGKTDHTQAYTKNQLLPVKENEIKAQESKIRPIGKKKGAETWIVEKLLNRQKIKNKIFFEVKWKGFKDSTLEPRTTLVQDVPDLVKEYEKNN